MYAPKHVKSLLTGIGLLFMTNFMLAQSPSSCPDIDSHDGFICSDSTGTCGVPGSGICNYEVTYRSTFTGQGGKPVHILITGSDNVVYFDSCTSDWLPGTNVPIGPIKFYAPCGLTFSTQWYAYTASNGSCQGKVCSSGSCDNGGTCELDPSLPVVLVSFDARYEADRVVLTWQTAQELNNDYFELERSADGIHFDPIRRIPGQSRSYKSETYQYEDKRYFEGDNYYRLKQYDLDGTNTLASNVIFINAAQRNQLQAKYLASRKMLIVEGGNSIQTRISLYNASGIQCLTQEMKGSTLEINLDQLHPGIYFLSDDQGRLKQKIFVR